MINYRLSFVPLLLVSATLAPAAESPIDFNRDIRPILSDRCFACHGPDRKKRKENLRLDTYAGAMADLKDGKGKVVVPGHPEQSAIWLRINDQDPKERMPPEDAIQKQLSASERELIRRWIVGGAQYEEHFAFTPIRKPPVPATADAAWPRTNIDRFILARLEGDGLKPAPEADRATLIRRATLDLTGLPPTPEEIDAFAADTTPDAWNRLIDRLLDSPRFGERMATPWLDAARYADTVGLHADEYHDYWHFRDWVIRAINANVPYDQFLTWQMAGDLLENPTEDQLVATGFHRLNPISSEGGAIDPELRFEYAADRVTTTGTAILGLTMTCSRCHDHKYDPITQEDFYSMIAYFNSVEEQGLYPGSTRTASVVGASIPVGSPEFSKQLDELKAKLTAIKAENEATLSKNQAKLEETIGTLKNQWQPVTYPGTIVSAKAANGTELKIAKDGVITAAGPNPDTEVYTIVLDIAGAATDLRLLRLEVLPVGNKPKTDKTGRSQNGNAVLTAFEVEAAPIAGDAPARKVAFSWAWADYEQPNGDFDVNNTIHKTPTNSKDGWAIGGHLQPGDRTAFFVAQEPFGFAGGTRLTIQLRQESPHKGHNLAKIRLHAYGAAAGSEQVFPTVLSEWFNAAGFPSQDFDALFNEKFGPESSSTIDLNAKFSEGKATWKHLPALKDGEVYAFSGDNTVQYFARTIFSPVARDLALSLGSDDALQVYHNGVEVLADKAQRGVAPDQNAVTLHLAPGENVLVCKVVNGGGSAGFYCRPSHPAQIFTRQPIGLFAPKELSKDDRSAWAAFLNGSDPLVAEVRKTEKEIKDLEGKIPRAMVMREVDKPTPTFVLNRGAYDAPDKDRPVSRRPLPFGPPADLFSPDRLGLAKWMVHPENPLVARVAVNQIWQIFFGNGIVRTPEDFGYQAQYPTHPQLLNALAASFIESGWDRKGLIREIMHSATYRQQTALRPDLIAVDPENHLLGRFPRRRLDAEQIRDQALFVSGLLVEKVGGKSVKPYQPGDMWEVMSLRGSPTNKFVRDQGENLYRRSLYTFWKRGCTPSQMAILDGPDRGACSVRRASTNTPLQALMLWNDEQFVEAARLLATRTMRETTDTDARLNLMFRRATGRVPEAAELAALNKALTATIERYSGDEAAAQKLIAEGEAPAAKDFAPAQLAAWTLLANTILTLDEAIVRD